MKIKKEFSDNEKSEIIEVKQGPYMGDEDKVRFDPSNSIKINKNK